MAFPFQTIPHRIYKNTTLQNVVITFEYGKKESAFYNEEFYMRFDDFMKRRFGLIVKHTLVEQPFQIKNNKFDSVFYFENGKVMVFIPRKDYVSFEDTAIPHVHRLKEFLKEVVNLSHLQNFSIRKINIWQVVDVENDPQEYLKNLKIHIFSEAFLNSTDTVRCSAEEENILFRKLSWSESDKVVTLRTAFVPTDVSKSYNLVLDSEVYEKNEEGIALEGLIDCLKRRNEDLFNAYHWCVNKQIIKQMEEV